MSEFQGEMDEEYGEGVALEFDNEFLDARFEVMELQRGNGLVGDEGIALLLQYGRSICPGGGAVLGLVDMFIAQFLGDPFGLIDAAGSVGAFIDLDQADNIGAFGLDEGNDALRILLAGTEIAREGERQMIAHARAGAVANVIQHELDSIGRHDGLNGALHCALVGPYGNDNINVKGDALAPTG